MSINLLTTKFIFPCTATVITGSGIGIGVYVHGGGGDGSVEQAPEYYHDYLKLDGLSRGVQSYLKSTDDFIEKKDTNTSVILARVLTTSNTDKNLIGKQLKCSSSGITEENCKVLLIQPKLTKTNIGKVLYSSLKAIKNPKIEAPKDSYVVVELTTKTDNIEGFKNKDITIKESSATLMTVAFNQPLFKETKTIDNESIVGLVPLKKNVVAHIGVAFLDDKNKLFANGFRPSSYNCSFIKKDSDHQAISQANVDDSCKIIQLDFPQVEDAKLMTLKDLLESKKPLTDAYEKRFFKIELDSNKFFNFEEKINKGGYRLQIKGVNGTKQTEAADFLLIQQIEDGKVLGNTKFVIAKYKEESKTLQLTGNETGECFLTKTQNTNPSGNDICDIYTTNAPKSINKENFTQIGINNTSQNKTIIKDSYYVIQFWNMQDIQTLITNKTVYFYKRDSSGNIKVAEPHEFEIAALLMDESDKDGQNILISDISI